MTLNLHTKLFFTLLLTLFFVIISMGAFIQWSFDRGLVTYVNTQELARLGRLSSALAERYEQEGSWRFLSDPQNETWRTLLRLHLFPSQANRPAKPVKPRPPFAKDDSDDAARKLAETVPKEAESTPRNLHRRLQLLDADRNLVIGQVIAKSGAAEQDILVNNKRVGILQILPQEDFSEANDLSFLKSQTQAFLTIAAAMGIIAAVVSFLIARRIITRITPLTNATKELASGNYDLSINVDHEDELGALSQDFNHLAHTLKHHEDARRQWVADIAHELRTPLAVLQGEIEAIQDGIREPNEKNLASLHSEVKHLSGLVNDLYELSMSDVGALTYRMEKLDAGEHLHECVERMRMEYEHNNIKIETELTETVEIYADPDRLQQLYNNLLKNTLRYTDKPGKLRISLHQDSDGVRITFADTAPGVSKEEAAKIFDRLYRVEKSRSRAHGGGGLGLSICKNIVTAHGGSIYAEPSDLGGLAIQIYLPLNGANPKVTS